MSASDASIRCAANFFAFSITLSVARSDRRAADRARPRAVGAHAERDARGVAVHDLDQALVDPEPVGDDLREARSRAPGRGCGVPVKTVMPPVGFTRTVAAS